MWIYYNSRSVSLGTEPANVIFAHHLGRVHDDERETDGLNFFAGEQPMGNQRNG